MGKKLNESHIVRSKIKTRLSMLQSSQFLQSHVFAHHALE